MKKPYNARFTELSLRDENPHGFRVINYIINHDVQIQIDVEEGITSRYFLVMSEQVTILMQYICTH